MSDMFIFDPNDVPGLADRWMEEVGNLHRGHKYNGYMFFNNDRELLDVYLPDVDGEWVDVGYDINTNELRGWGGVVERAKSVGATDLIVIHAHLDSEPEGPCPDMMAFSETGVKVLDGMNNIHFRGIVILNGDRLDGMVFITEPSGVPSLPEDTIEELRRVAANGDAHAAKVLPLIEEIQSALQRGEMPAPELLDQAINATIEALSAIEMQQPVNPLSLPIFDINNKELLN